MVPNVAQLKNRLKTTRARPGQPAEAVLQVASRGVHAFCAPPHTLLVLLPYIFQSAVPVQQLDLARFSYWISWLISLNCLGGKGRGPRDDQLYIVYHHRLRVYARNRR